MQAGIKRVTDGASGLVRVTGHVAAWSALALVLVVAFNVLARYLFSYGTVALQEAEWHIMAVSALFGMSYGLNQGGEVRVDIFYGTMRPRTQALVDFVSNIALFALALIIAWLCIAYVQSSYAINEGSPDPGGLGYRYLLKATMPLAFVLLAVQAVAMTGHAALKLMTRPPERQE
ncbi:MAG: C4-dicarboxylate ABC transporter permease [Roseovarius sp. BRH_c41]|jgi:TRAP-type mannitol/chloroaromatic compound transport system permease small subunit|uniref:TRAP transporter small permease subunit n=1 Tax=Roseovarius sp. BRH_c41 TaxID=1629709 RepID=UPI0005F0E8BD|nr:TRAP transporter small permease subunit [Roseovarius sp. BRH_c41]KJS45551.1 MAG: C4-dicarboxylate ABC transporter permease [Roseovarius sp. BRH_c41]